MFPQLKLRYFTPAIFATSLQCIALDPAYWDCDESPSLGKVIDEELSWCPKDSACELPLSKQSSLILFGQSCDAIYPLEIASVTVEPSYADWSIEQDQATLGFDEVTVDFYPRKIGEVRLYLEYEWHSGKREVAFDLSIVSSLKND